MIEWIDSVHAYVIVELCLRSYPATSPYITAVGATQGPEVMSPEIMCSSSTGGGVTSGGGFSDYYPMPHYQKAAYQAYFANPAAKLPPSNMYNGGGRGYPDVAMLGHNYVISKCLLLLLLFTLLRLC
jgi:tripeptidyl-peptidase-1